ncbi:hypothetical protein BDA96_04G349100 [Sorghum bicolor]|uniref:Uncharacterized protein n=2 Tax=Sorghum bicolor TaxID=4558 RepID=A0A921UKW0_SORBI|nr:hypothetical protein BDA96_04G349100 [Sorghum bicolor]OQU85857.1 hypothetical protein SORBI_3004G326650 [Sorghum bicolor]
MYLPSRIGSRQHRTAKGRGRNRWQRGCSGAAASSPSGLSGTPPQWLGPAALRECDLRSAPATGTWPRRRRRRSQPGAPAAQGRDGHGLRARSPAWLRRRRVLVPCVAAHACCSSVARAAARACCEVADRACCSPVLLWGDGSGSLAACVQRRRQ